MGVLPIQFFLSSVFLHAYILSDSLSQQWQAQEEGK